MSRPRGRAGAGASLKARPVHERPRERALARGLGALAGDELLALVLGTGTRARDVLATSRALLADAGGLTALAALGPAELARLGLGPAKALRVAAACELGRRALERPGLRARVDTSAALADLGRARLAGERQEVLLVVALSAGLEVMRSLELARGAVSGAALPLPELLGAVLREGAPRFALIHNHPGGDPLPSAADVTLTRRVQAASALVGLELVDHVVVARERHASLRALGLLSSDGTPSRSRVCTSAVTSKGLRRKASTPAARARSR